MLIVSGRFLMTYSHSRTKSDQRVNKLLFPPKTHSFFFQTSVGRHVAMYTGLCLVP